MNEPQRWLPTKGRRHAHRAIMVQPDMKDDDGNVLTYKVWPDGSPELDHHAMVWKAEMLRAFFDPEKDGDD